MEPGNDVRLEGLLVYTTIPTEDIYKRRFDLRHLSYDEINALIAELEELFNGKNGIDEEYSKRITRERNFRVNRRNIRVKDRYGRSRRVEIPELEFYVVPHRVANWMKRVRSLYYTLLNKYAIKIPLARWDTGEEQKNVRERNLYLIPKPLIPRFMDEFRELNEIYDEIHTLVMDFAYSPYFEKLHNILEKYGLKPPEKVFYHSRRPHARLRILQLEMTPEIMKQWAETDPEVAREIERQTRELVQSAVMQLKKDIEPLIAKIQKNMEKWLQEGGEEIRMEILEEIDLIQRKAEYLGLERFESLERVSAMLRGEIEVDMENVYSVLPEMDERITSFVDNVKRAMSKDIGKKVINRIDEGGIEL